MLMVQKKKEEQMNNSNTKGKITFMVYVVTRTTIKKESMLRYKERGNDDNATFWLVID